MAFTKNKFSIAKEQLQNDYNNLGSAAQVAKKYGVSKKLILNHMKALGIDRRLSNDQKSEWLGMQIRELAEKDYSAKEIAAILDCSSDSIYKIAKRYGITIRNKYHKGYAVSLSGYILIKKPDHKNADSKGYVREHRLVMEDYLGRYLDKGECVHHLDGNRSNNAIENLELMIIEDHVSLHHTGKDGRSKNNKPQNVSK